MVGVIEWGVFLELVNTAVFQFEDCLITVRFFVYSLFDEYNIQNLVSRFLLYGC